MLNWGCLLPKAMSGNWGSDISGKTNCAFITLILRNFRGSSRICAAFWLRADPLMRSGIKSRADTGREGLSCSRDWAMVELSERNSLVWDLRKGLVSLSTEDLFQIGKWVGQVAGQDWPELKE